MKKIIKNILKYIIIFIVTVLILFGSLVLTAKIPKSSIEKNIKASLDFYKKYRGIYYFTYKRYDTYIHYYADTRKLNILYNIDSNDAIKSVLWDKFYQETHMDSNVDFINLVEKDKEPNTNYLRYWNGCMVFLRPLLTIMSMDKIYLINIIILSILALILLVLLFLRSKKMAIIFIISLILTSCWYVPICIEYSVMFYVMIITSILTLLIDKKDSDVSKSNNKLLILFLITGITATFFDFLTTEILTIFVPLIFIIIIRKKENRLEDFKKTTIFILKACILWFLGYGLMWLTKWVLSSLILKINAFDYVKRNFTLRFNGLQGIESKTVLYKNVIPRNVFCIPFMYYIRENFDKLIVKYFVFLFIMLILIFIDWKSLKEKKYYIFLLIISFMPYVRYLILANHSYKHLMFTFRDQIITLIVLIYIIIDSFNYKLLFKKVDVNIPLKNKNKK